MAIVITDSLIQSVILINLTRTCDWKFQLPPFVTHFYFLPCSAENILRTLFSSRIYILTCNVRIRKLKRRYIAGDWVVITLYYHILSALRCMGNSLWSEASEQSLKNTAVNSRQKRTCLYLFTLRSHIYQVQIQTLYVPLLSPWCIRAISVVCSTMQNA